MLIFWFIRFLDRNEKLFKDRVLSLDTDGLPAAGRAAVELIVEMGSSRSDREFIKLRALFSEEGPSDVSKHHSQSAGKTKTFTIPNYFEDETGNEIEMAEIWKHLKPVDEDDPERAPEPGAIPLAQISLTEDEVRLLGYFTRDYKELSGSALMKEGPGRITTFGGIRAPGGRPPSFKTALTDDELRSFVTIFRRLYMESEPADLRSATDLFVRLIGDHPYARLVSRFATDYETHMNSECDAPPFMRAAAWQFTTKRLIDVFLYTQYAHQPDERRQRQFNQCLAQVHGDCNVLTWLFLYEIWLSSIHIVNAGRAIDAWFRAYCDHYGITPDVLNSLREGVGFGALEKDEDRRARLFREKVEGLEMEHWKRAGAPEGGPAQFRAMARDQLTRALGGESREGP